MATPTRASAVGVGVPLAARELTLRGLVRLIHPFPSLLVTAVTLALVPLADSEAEPWLYVQLGLGMLLFQFAIGAANDFVDRVADAAEKPGKPIAAGLVSPRAALLIAVGCAGGGLIGTIALDPGAWLVGAAGLLCGLAYDAQLKRTALSWLPFAIAFPLIPVWVFMAAGAWDNLLWWTFPGGALLGSAVHVANQLPDIRGDRRQGLRGVAQRLGTRRAVGLALMLYGSGVLLTTGVLLFESQGRAALTAAAGAVAFLVGPRATRLFGRDGLFGVLAVSSATVAVVFLSAV